MATAKLRSSAFSRRAQGVDLQRAISTASTAAASEHNETTGLLARGRAYLGDLDVALRGCFYAGQPNAMTRAAANNVVTWLCVLDHRDMQFPRGCHAWRKMASLTQNRHSDSELF
jgi:hypothetical protein